MSEPTDSGAFQWLRGLAIVWLVFLGAYGLGYMTHRAELWPFASLEATSEFIFGDGVEQTTLSERVLNDFGVRPSRHIVETQRVYEIPENYGTLDGLPLAERRSPPLMFLSPEAPGGFRLIYGTFDFEDGLHGALLLDADGKVQQRWVVRQDDAEWAERPDTNVYPHGIEILRDGSIIVAWDGGTSISRYGYCGDLQWRTKGHFHHSVTLDGEDAVWAWGNPEGKFTQAEYMVKVSVEDGSVLASINLDHVWPANTAIDPFAIKQEDRADGSFWNFDRFHVNDVDPLPARFADAYPQFETGDLLISLRSINLVAVVDPDTMDVKWWRQGLVRRQHDPDWNERGTITIFDNNMHRDYSRIYEINPVTYESTVVVPGEPYEFYTWHRGKHDVLPGGLSYLVTSTEQGRLFELDAEGEIVFDFINRYQPGGKFLAVSEGRFLPLDYFEELPACES
ncbi:MAG: arylsulfotransferase family protein [Pseudomonadota bacterium]